MSKILKPRIKRMTSSASSSNEPTTETSGAPMVLIEMGDEGEADNNEPTTITEIDMTHQQHDQKRPGSPKPTGKCSSFRRKCRRFYRKLGLKHMVTFLIIVLYTVIGAGIFLSVERSSDQNRLDTLRQDHRDHKSAVIRQLLSGNRSSSFRTESPTQQEQSLVEMMEQYDDLVELAGHDYQTQWNFWHAMYFAGTIYSTIGYGDLFCRTTTGQLLTMLYSLVGIPLMLSTLTDLGNVLLKMMFKLTNMFDKCKANCSPTALLGPHPPDVLQTRKSGKDQSSQDDDPDLVPEGRMDQSEVSDDDLELTELERREDEQYEMQLSRVSVTTALLVTVSWIFVCAGLFCLWEDWTYFTSIYFFFISLSTIGLGDVVPDHKKIMVLTYFLVIIGLALVSMCITIIQRRLEDLYLHLLRLILQEYHKQLRQGNDQIGATVGMMGMWKNNKMAKFLLPLLSKDKKQTVAQKFQDEAKAKGLVLPAILRDLDPKTGIPAVLRVAKERVIEGQSQLREAVSNAISRAAEKARILNEPISDEVELETVYGVSQADVYESKRRSPFATASAAAAATVVTPPAPPIVYDADAQTDQLLTEDKQEQTISAQYSDAQTQSNVSSLAANQHVDEASQTPVTETDDISVQCQPDDFGELAPPTPTPPPEEQKPVTDEQTTQTDEISSTECGVQTHKTVVIERELQTHLFDMSPNETQTEIVETKNQRLQTPIPDIVEREAQTDPLVLDPEQFQATGTLSMATDHSGNHGWAKLNKNIRDMVKKATSAKLKAPSSSSGMKASPSLLGMESIPAMASWSDVVGGEGDEIEQEAEEVEPVSFTVAPIDDEDLHWDPIDGLHAEKQRKVSDLKKMFEKPGKPTRQSKRKK